MVLMGASVHSCIQGMGEWQGTGPAGARGWSRCGCEMLRVRQQSDCSLYVQLDIPGPGSRGAPVCTFIIRSHTSGSPAQTQGKGGGGCHPAHRRTGEEGSYGHQGNGPIQSSSPTSSALGSRCPGALGNLAPAG